MVGLWTDLRVAGTPRLVHGDDRKLMQTPAELRKLVTFVRAEVGGKAWVGAAFLVSVPLDSLEPHQQQTYATQRGGTAV